MKFFRLGIVILTSFVFSCVQITESPIEGENWSRSGSHLGAPWKIEKKGQALKVKIKDSKISLYPDLVINGVIIKKCGISSVGPSSTDFDFELPENGALYEKNPYSYSFKIDSSLHIFTLSKEITEEGELYLQSKFSFNLLTNNITLKEIIHNPANQDREVQFAYLVKSKKEALKNYQSIFPLNEQSLNQLNVNNETPVEFCGLRKDKTESYYPIDQGFLKISHPDLSCVSQLDLGTQMISNSYYQSRNLARQMGRVPLVGPFLEKTFITNMSVVKKVPQSNTEFNIENKLESHADLDIKK